VKHFPVEDSAPWQARHRGPYRLLVVRTSKGKTGHRNEWLPGTVPTWDADEEAQALLTDRRDSILRVHVWSDREQQFVMTYPQRPPVRVTAKKEQAA
jgi:hypothetical protein